MFSFPLYLYTTQAIWIFIDFSLNEIYFAVACYNNNDDDDDDDDNIEKILSVH